MPFAFQDALENGVIIREEPFGSRPIVAPRLSRWLSPSRWWMWRKWYTSRNASAVTFQLHGTTSERRATVRRAGPCSSASCSGLGAIHASSGVASASWLTKSQPSQISQRRGGRHRVALSNPTKSRSSGTATRRPSVMSYVHEWYWQRSVRAVPARSRTTGAPRCWQVL